MKIKWVVMLALFVAVLTGGLILAQKTDAPAISVTTITGKSLALQQLRGKVVLVNFWATTCEACVKEMPKMAATLWR